jgi:hypothetical protein
MSIGRSFHVLCGRLHCHPQVSSFLQQGFRNALEFRHGRSEPPCSLLCFATLCPCCPLFFLSRILSITVHHQHMTLWDDVLQYIICTQPCYLLHTTLAAYCSTSSAHHPATYCSTYHQHTTLLLTAVHHLHTTLLLTAHHPAAYCSSSSAHNPATYCSTSSALSSVLQYISGFRTSWQSLHVPSHHNQLVPVSTQLKHIHEQGQNKQSCRTLTSSFRRSSLLAAK